METKRKKGAVENRKEEKGKKMERPQFECDVNRFQFDNQFHFAYESVV